MAAAKVLVIDDESDILDTLAPRLEHNHFECVTATTANEGLELALKLKPDLILLDLNLPQMSGFGFLREMKNNEKLKGIPVIVFTALGDEEIAREAMDLGAVGFLVKTCDTRELLSMVKTYASDLQTH